MIDMKKLSGCLLVVLVFFGPFYGVYQHGYYFQESGSAGDIINEHQEITALNLDEQRRIADATVNLMWVGVLGLILTSIGLTFLFFTLLYTKKAAEVTGETLTIARETLEETKENSKRELRAYVFLTSIDCSWRPFDHDHMDNIPNGLMVVEFKVVNQGRTPAKSLRTHAVFEIYRGPGRANLLNLPIYSQLDLDQQDWEHHGELGTETSGELSIEKIIPLDEDQDDAIVGDEAIIEARIYVKYKDIYGRDFISSKSYSTDLARVANNEAALGGTGDKPLLGFETMYYEGDEEQF